MANNEFKNIEEFIEGFTRIGPTPENYTYDGVIWGMEFKYKNRIFRVTRDIIGNEKYIRIKFNKSDKAYIQLLYYGLNRYEFNFSYTKNLYRVH